MVAGLILLFGAAFIWIASSNSTSVEGAVTAGESKMEVFGCLANLVSDELTLALRDNPPKEGFHEEKRALILKDNSLKGETSTARPVEDLSVAYRNETGIITPLECATTRQELTIRRGLRSGGRSIGRSREEQWNGILEASCNSEITGPITFNVEMKNCD